MTDYASFSHGAVQFPLPAQGSSLLKDADPAIFYLLEFYASVLKTHLEARFLAEAAATGTTDISAIVAETLPVNPDPYLTEEHIRFPLLCAYRDSSKYDYKGQKKLSVDTIEVSYVLPPLTAGYAERLMPILYAVAACLDNRTERAMDPTYQPTGASTYGYPVWELAGVARAEVKSVKYGAYAPTQKLLFPAVMLKVELQALSDLVQGDFQMFGGADAQIDFPATDTDAELDGVVQFTAPNE